MARSAEPRGARRPPRPTARGLAVLVVGAVLVVAGLALGLQYHFFVGALLVLAVAGSLLSLRWSRLRLTVRRSIRPDAVSTGESTEVILEAAGPDASLVDRGWRDAFPEGFVVADARTTADGAARVLRYALRTTRRGRYDVGPLRLRRVDPLGLASVRAAVGESASILVSPRIVPLDDSPLDDAAAGGTELVIMRRSTPSVDEVSAREYERGDPLRRINWRASAKRGRLMVRQEEQRSNPQSWLLLDTVGAPLARPSDAFELGIELPVSIAAHAMERGFTVGIVEAGEPQLRGDSVQHGAGYQPPEGTRLLGTELAGLIPALPAADPVGQFADALRRGGVGTTAFAVLGAGRSEWWDELAGLRGLAEPCVAFLLTEKSASAEPALRAAGWTCVVMAGGSGVAEGWAEANEALGRRIGVHRG